MGALFHILKNMKGSYTFESSNKAARLENFVARVEKLTGVKQHCKTVPSRKMEIKSV